MKLQQLRYIWEVAHHDLNVSATDSSTGNGPYTLGQAFALTVAAPTLTLTPAGGTAFKVVKTKKALKKLKKATKKCDFTLIDGKLKLTQVNGRLLSIE